jgi:hypothetical protein
MPNSVRAALVPAGSARPLSRRCASTPLRGRVRHAWSGRQRAGRGLFHWRRCGDMISVMGAWRALTAGVAVAVVLSGCGSGGHKASTTTDSSASSSTTAASPPASGIRSRVLTSNELAGFHVVDVSVRTTPNSWVSAEQIPPDQAAAEKAMLKRDGFRDAVHEDLTSGATPGLSIVVQFRSPQAAADALGFYLMQLRASGPYTPFKVTGIPHAVGFSIGPIAGGINIMFSDGAYYYLIGQEAGSMAAIANLNTAARHLYHRVHG